MKRALLVKADDWEGLWIDKEFVEQGHTIEEGYDRGIYFVGLAEKYNLKKTDFKVVWISSNQTIEHLNTRGAFPRDYGKLLTLIEDDL